MEENILKINSMLLSQDDEMRKLGRFLMEALPTGTDIWGKILLYLNCGKGAWMRDGERLFMTLKKNRRNYERLLDLLGTHGYRGVVVENLKRIDIQYKRVKKLHAILQEDETLAEFLKNNPGVSITRGAFSYGYDD